MPKSELMRGVQRALRACEDARRADSSARGGGAGLTRRQLLGRAGVAGLGASALGGMVASTAFAAPRPAGRLGRVVVVGAGLAGLTAAFALKQAGVTAEVYEGSTRLGGRCRTGRGRFDEGQIVEFGGELIDTGHRAIRQLAFTLGLELDDVLAAEPAGTDALYWFAGGPYTVADAVADWQAVYPRLQEDYKAAGYPTLYTSFTEAGRQLDAMSVRDWIESRVPGGSSSRLGALLDVAYTIEYGADTAEQSALNLIYLLGDSSRKSLALFGASDERFKVRGGNDLIVQRLAQELDGQIRTGTPLTAIRSSSDGRVELAFDGLAGGPLTADQVILALPFSVMRARVDFAGAGFSALKLRAINELGMGSNGKLQLQFRHRIWNEQGCTGETYADTGYQNTWEVTRAQPGTSGILVNYTGAAAATRLVGAQSSQEAARLLAQLESLIPGISQEWNGNVTMGTAIANPWSLGAYSYWKTGQYVGFAGAEGEPSGAIHFAGEHTSIDYQGYLNGAVDSGLAAANELITGARISPSGVRRGGAA